MTRRIFTLGAAALLSMTSLSNAGEKERRLIKNLLFPPVPVPIGNRVVDVNSVFRTGKVKSVKLPKPVVPKVVVPKIVVPKVVAPRPSVCVKATVNRRQNNNHNHNHHYGNDHKRKKPVRLYYVTRRPPSPVSECRCRRPSNRHVWVSGYWARYGNAWQWKGGSWVAQPVTGARWHDGSWERTCRGWQWMSGYWEYPRPQYRSCNRGQSHTHNQSRSSRVTFSIHRH